MKAHTMTRVLVGFVMLCMTAIPPGIFYLTVKHWNSFNAFLGFSAFVVMTALAIGCWGDGWKTVRYGKLPNEAKLELIAKIATTDASCFGTLSIYAKFLVRVSTVITLNRVKHTIYLVTNHALTN